MAAQPGLLATLGGSVAAGTFLSAPTAGYPAVVLGAVAAQTLGIDHVRAATQVYLAGEYFTVIDILRPVPLAPEIDEAALVAFPVADSLLGLDRRPGRDYLRAVPDQVQPVASVLPFTANPAQPDGGAGQPAVEHPRGPGVGAHGLHRAVLGLAPVACWSAGSASATSW